MICFRSMFSGVLAFLASASALNARAQVPCCSECEASGAFFESRDAATVQEVITKKVKDASGVEREVKSVILKEVLWGLGQNIDIVLLENAPSKSILDQMKSHFRHWEKHTNLRITIFDNVTDFASEGDGNAEVRIAFSNKGHYSRLGKNSAGGLSDHSMNLQFDASTSDAEVRRVTLHEFGHAIGFQHEHLNPSAGIKWKQPDAMNYYKSTTGWDEAKINYNIFKKLDASKHLASKFDKLSIMAYSFPASITENGVGVDWNTQLSQTDAKWAEIAYPFVFLKKLGLYVRVAPGTDVRNGVTISGLTNDSKCKHLHSDTAAGVFGLEPGDRIMIIDNSSIDTLDDAKNADKNADGSFRIVVESVNTGDTFDLHSH